MGAHFSAVEMDNAIRFSVESGPVPWYFWHSSKWSCRFGRAFQYTSELEVLAYSIDTNFSNVITMLQSYVYPIGLVKTEPGFIVRSVETGLGR